MMMLSMKLSRVRARHRLQGVESMLTFYYVSQYYYLLSAVKFYYALEILFSTILQIVVTVTLPMINSCRWCVTAISEVFTYIPVCLCWNTARHALLPLCLSVIGLIGTYGVYKVVRERVLKDDDDVIYEAVESWSQKWFAVVRISHFGNVCLYSRLPRVQYS